MKWIVDRLEGDFAVVELEDKSVADIPLKSLPKGIKEGDVINISVAESETAQRKEKIDSLAKKLFK